MNIFRSLKRLVKWKKNTIEAVDDEPCKLEETTAARQENLCGFPAVLVDLLRRASNE
jgi:hypothetical protein